MQIRRIARSLLLAALASTAALAQIGTSTMTGRVTDTTGAVVPKVQVTVVQLGTNFTQNTITNDEGLYRILSLQPGAYRVTFESQGFKKAVRDNVELRTGDTLAVDMAMQVGNVTESTKSKARRRCSKPKPRPLAQWSADRCSMTCRSTSALLIPR